MTTTQWLLGFHLVGAFLFVSGAVAVGLLHASAVRRERPSEVAFLLGLTRCGRRRRRAGRAGRARVRHVARPPQRPLLRRRVDLGLAGAVDRERRPRRHRRALGPARPLPRRGLAAAGDAPSDDLRRALAESGLAVAQLRELPGRARDPRADGLEARRVSTLLFFHVLVAMVLAGTLIAAAVAAVAARGRDDDRGDLLRCFARRAAIGALAATIAAIGLGEGLAADERAGAVLARRVARPDGVRPAARERGAGRARRAGPTRGPLPPTARGAGRSARPRRARDGVRDGREAGQASDHVTAPLQKAYRQEGFFLIERGIPC